MTFDHWIDLIKEKIQNIMNRAEGFVYQICRKSFLSLWSYANPQGKNGKELCDILVVCDAHILIFSVKEIEYKDSGSTSRDWNRWSKRAIEDSCKQIYGAERWIKSANNLIRKDGMLGISFPKISKRKLHRVAVALGSQGKAPIQSGDYGKGFVHVFDDISFNIILNELDTITDFITYLIDKENLCESETSVVFEGGEENLLAMYLHNNRKFTYDHDTILVGDDLWNYFKNKREYKNKKLADRDSYAWDNLIEVFCNDTLHGKLEGGASLNEAEMVTRIMAQENRFQRRILGKCYKEFVELSSQNKVRSRMIPSDSGVVYVFLALPHGEDRQFRRVELANRCFVARGLNLDKKHVVGIATEQYKPGVGFSLDAFYLYKELWTDEDQTTCESMQKELGYFHSPISKKISEDEYPVN